jgi:hypothetical protein
VHALRHVHRVLMAGGTLVDMHPVTEELVESGDGIVGVILEPDWIAVDLPNSEAVLRETVSEGLYALEAETEYDVLEHFEDADDLINAKRDLLEGQDALVTAISSASAPLTSRMHIVMRRLRALPDPIG